LTGKAVGYVLDLAGAERTHVVAGSVSHDLAGDRSTHAVSLTELAGSGGAALAEPARWLRLAAAQVAAGVLS
jgi:glycerate kinase